MTKPMDYWRKTYLLPAIAEKKKIALIGIGDNPEYWVNTDLHSLAKHWDPARLAVSDTPYKVYDIDSTLVERASELNINADTCDVCKDRLSDTYDYIFASDVIEHVHDPVHFFQNIAASLLPKGRFVLTTPNALYWRNFFFGVAHEHPEHNFCFTKDHIQNLARRNGLRCEAIGTFQSLGIDASSRQKLLAPLHSIFASLGRANSLYACLQKTC